MDVFALEAVSLGSLKRAIIGHDGTGPGQGWYLDKVVIKETPKGMSWAFPCDKLVAGARYQCYIQNFKANHTLARLYRFLSVV